MTSETEAIKTNEFLRRRKLRLQQVREQSKDIAKKIRQRAKVEQLRQIVDLDATKQKEYFECQDKLIKHLEVLYARGLDNVGASHQSATELTRKDAVTKSDLSKLRGKEAAAALRKQKQEKLDQQKKLLDRKLQARETANEISRDKSSTVAQKLSSKSTNIHKVSDEAQTAEQQSSTELINKESKKDAEKVNTEQESVKTSDMATQWDIETIPAEWEPAVPALALPIDKDSSPREEDNAVSKTDKKRLDLFALSKEMPSSLRGKHTHESRPRETTRPSLTLVSEYLQNRKLRLRENDPVITTKKPSDDINSLKQTILQTRSSRPEGKGPNLADKPKNSQDTALNRKNSVTMYNHSTRDTRDLPCGDNKLVVRDMQSEEDAYSQAMKEVTCGHSKDRDHQRKVQDMRNKVAVTKQNVEKEYKDTMNFLNSLPKEKTGKVNKTAYMDDRRQRLQQESRQLKMQEEYKKIEKECKKHQCMNKRRSKSKSPTKQYQEDDFDTSDFQYSWMPVPESDSNLAIHAIPNTVKQKSGNSVKFSTVDSYHEYRSRHKHTPPTKDTQDKHPKKFVETVIIDKDPCESSDSCSLSISDTSSVQNLILDEELKSKNAKEINKNLSDAERIIIYKVLDSRTDKKSKRQTKLLNEIAKSLSCIEKGQIQKAVSENNSEQSKKPQTKSIKSSSKSAENAVSFEQLNEGVYKMVEEQGDNVASMYFSEHDKVAADGLSSDDKPQSCHCQLTKESPKKKSTLLHWESGDCLQPPRTIEVCQCGTVLKEKEKKSLPKYASTGPSTSSFITATNAKGSSSDQSGGYIKLVDETGQEAGKFFIGASGLLKDNAYEVVLQLRKKEGVKDKPSNEKDELVQSNQSENVISRNNDEKDPISETDTTDTNNIQQPSDDLREALESRSVETQESKEISGQEIQNEERKNIVSEEVMTDTKIHSRTNTESIEDICLIQSTTKMKDKRDQSVHAVFNHVPIPDMPARPATTTYTQTTLSSPVHRPVFFHMSSSTSTAYMSPPEMILPKYFKRNFPAPEDELYDVMYDPVETIEMTEKEYCEEYSGCTCMKCMHARKVTLKQNSYAPFRKKMYDHKKMRTPPNTARTSSDNRHDIHALNPKKVTTPSKTARLEKGKCKYNGGNGEPVKKQCRRNKRPSVENIPSARNINMHVGLNLKSGTKVKTSRSNHNKMGKSKLNPIIKDYINKLLALNRQGLKAVKVADQECSSVGTPGSSIINVPHNVDENKPLGNTISIEHIKNLLKQQIMEKQMANNMNHAINPVVQNSSSKNLKNSFTRLSRKKPVHKVKSLNISKHLIKKNLLGDVTSRQPLSPSSTDDNFKPIDRPNVRPNRQTRSRSSPTPRQIYASEHSTKFNDTESSAKNSTGTVKTDGYNIRSAMTIKSISPPLHKNESNSKCPANSQSKQRINATSPDTETTGDFQGYKHNAEIPVSMSTQTNQNVDSDSKFIQLAEDKLHNMEKIADLTEKCTKRLSNLAKVLEEVRKNKSLAYSQISSADSTDSQSDHKSDRATSDPNKDTHIPQRLEIKSPEPIFIKNHNVPKEKVQSQYMPVLTDIPKPVFKVPVEQEPRATSEDKLDSHLHLNVYTTELTVKPRPRPPPALSRINLKHGQEYIIPHELSTVIEVDSPMSMKHKHQTSRNDAIDAANNSNKSSPGDKLIKTDKRNESAVKDQESSINPDLLGSNANFSNKFKLSSTGSSEESKFHMIDLKQFNEIMLEPFISIQEYAKQYNMEPPDEGSNMEQREDVINDDMSSLHSDGSLPDVIAELLKRNIITEPFKFDTVSNINSTTISSESTLSMLALSKVRKDRKRSSVLYQNKESVAETSDTLSISSNPDLENAFKKLGMGWASSTLKKTKERLALSSSSNTSSSSIPHFKMKSFNQDIPALVTDSVSSALNSSKTGQQCQIDVSKNAEQQTTLSNSMTVKEFLRNELAKKITFNNKSDINDTEEFVSLFETKMPEELKENSQMNRERSMDSAPSGTNRARTSTPVQLFKSMTYHSSSSSNVSNGLFSNADDLSSVKITSNSIRNHSTSDKDDLTIPNFSLRLRKTSDCSKSD